MANIASKTSSLMSGLRSSYAGGGVPVLGSTTGRQSGQSVQPIPIAPTPQTSIPAVAPPPQPTIADLDRVIAEVEAERVQEELSEEQAVPDQENLGTIATAYPQMVDQAFQEDLQATNQQVAFRGPSRKENVNAVSAPQEVQPTAQPESPQELPPGVQSVEQSLTPEISPEVESFIEHAQNLEDQLPQEIVVADNQEVSAVTHYPKQPVIVLPITEEQYKKGKKKSPKLSFRWLIEFSIKIMKKFSGKVIYKQMEQAT